MKTDTASSKRRGKSTDTGPRPAEDTNQPAHCECCTFDIHVESQGDVNIYNSCGSNEPGAEPPPKGDENCFPPEGACLPVVPGAKHKQGRDHKLNKLADGIGVPSAIAAGTVHMMRRFLLGKSAATPLETAAFATLEKMSRNILSCSVAAFDAIPPRQRGRLFPASLVLDPNQPLDQQTLAEALAQELIQRVGLEVFQDPQGAEQERPGKIRVFEPGPEDFFNQCRICSINDIRTVNFIPPIGDAFLPSEIQRDCEIKIVDGQPESVCENRVTDCPGNSITTSVGVVCGRVLDVATGDAVILQGVNYFSIDAKVRFSDKQTGAVLRDVDAHVFGDIDTEVTETVGGETRLINDCRVHDRLTFRVPDDLPPAVYQIQVVVPNITGIAALGTELVSNVEFINVIPPSTARFAVVTERIIARQETSPTWAGSDEVGLHTLAAALDLNFALVNPDNPLQEQKFKDIQNVEFDSGTPRDITRNVFTHSQPILAMLLVVLGDEIDSQKFYDQQVTSQTEFFFDLVKQEAAAIAAAIGALKAAGISLAALGTAGIWVAAIAAVVLIAIDIVLALWAPADPIIRDSIGLSVTDLANLTSVSVPIPEPRTFTSAEDIVVNVNKTIPSEKSLFQFKETREYVSADEESRYEIIYLYNRLA